MKRKRSPVGIRKKALSVYLEKVIHESFIAYCQDLDVYPSQVMNAFLARKLGVTRAMREMQSKRNEQ